MSQLSQLVIEAYTRSYGAIGQLEPIVDHTVLYENVAEEVCVVKLHFRDGLSATLFATGDVNGLETLTDCCDGGCTVLMSDGEMTQDN